MYTHVLQKVKRFSNISIRLRINVQEKVWRMYKCCSSIVISFAWICAGIDQAFKMVEITMVSSTVHTQC